MESNNDMASKKSLKDWTRKKFKEFCAVHQSPSIDERRAMMEIKRMSLADIGVILAPIDFIWNEVKELNDKNISNSKDGKSTACISEKSYDSCLSESPLLYNTLENGSCDILLKKKYSEFTMQHTPLNEKFPYDEFSGYKRWKPRYSHFKPLLISFINEFNAMEIKNKEIEISQKFVRSSSHLTDVEGVLEKWDIDYINSTYAIEHRNNQMEMHINENTQVKIDDFGPLINLDYNEDIDMNKSFEMISLSDQEKDIILTQKSSIKDLAMSVLVHDEKDFENSGNREKDSLFFEKDSIPDMSSLKCNNSYENCTNEIDIDVETVIPKDMKDDFDGIKILEKSNQRKKRKKKMPSPRNSILDESYGTIISGGIRKSQRKRLPPLRYWIGEAKIYGRQHKSLATICGYIRRPENPMWPYPSPKRYRS